MALYITDNTSYITPATTSCIKTGRTEFGEMGIYKLLEYVDVDYDGYGEMKIYLDNTLTSTIQIPQSESRTTKRLYSKLTERQPFNFVKLEFYGINFYNAELEITPVPKY